MSGATCASCGCPYLMDCAYPDPLWKSPAQCQLCGWKGDIADAMREWLTEEAYESYSRDLELKKAGKLFFLRITVKDKSKEDVSKTTFAIMDLLGIQGMSSQGDNPCHCMIRLHAKPADALLKKIKALPGILEMEVF